MRCGNQIIAKGDAQAKVLKHCGEPVTTASRYIERAGVYRSDDDSLIQNDKYLAFGRSEVFIEEWTYNLGPNQLMRKIRFANGVVEEVETLGYGYREDAEN